MISESLKDYHNKYCVDNINYLEIAILNKCMDNILGSGMVVTTDMFNEFKEKIHNMCYIDVAYEVPIDTLVRNLTDKYYQKGNEVYEYFEDIE